MGMIALAFLLTSVLLNFSTPLDFADAFLLGALLVLLPSMAVLQLRMLEDEPLEREAVYLGSGATILLLGGASFLTGMRRIGLDGMGLGRIDAGSFLLWTVGLTAAGFALMAAFHWVGLRLRIDETSMLEQLLPETPREKALFAGLSLCAGIGEELAYRAYAITTIALALTAFTASGPTGVAGGPDAAAAAARAAASGATEGAILWLSILVASGAFGFLHAYQGVIGILRTASLGFVLAVSFLMTGNLWPAVAAHTLIDLLVGLVLGKHILRYGRGNGD
jgi:membrane protease YdiL (CAAX protease family)